MRSSNFTWKIKENKNSDLGVDWIRAHWIYSVSKIFLHQIYILRWKTFKSNLNFQFGSKRLEKGFSHEPLLKVLKTFWLGSRFIDLITARWSFRSQTCQFSTFKLNFPRHRILSSSLKNNQHQLLDIKIYSVLYPTSSTNSLRIAFQKGKCA